MLKISVSILDTVVGIQEEKIRFVFESRKRTCSLLFSNNQNFELEISQQTVLQARLWTGPDIREDDMKDENKGRGKRCDEGTRENK